MTEHEFDLSRRTVLGAIGAIGAASAGAGLGTSALFSDQETFEDNRLVAGELDLKVDWEEHYSFPQIYGFDDPTDGLRVTRTNPESDDYVGFPDPDDPVVWVHEDDLPSYMANTAIEAFPDPNGDRGQETQVLSDGESLWRYDPCVDGADLPDNLDPTVDEPYAVRTNNADTYDEEVGPKPIVSLEDVKPGDFGELTLSFHLCDNPGYVWVQAADVEDLENGIQEAEAAVDETSDVGELASKIQTVWWYDSRGDNVLQTNCAEKLYLVDSVAGSGSATKLFEVDLTGGNAELTEIFSTNGDNFDQTDAIAATPNGDEIIFYDRNSEHIGRYNVEADSFTDVGAASGPGGIVLAGYSPSGVLWAASQDDDNLYTIDPSVPSITAQGDTGINLQGADLVFASDGTLYIWSSASGVEGLYKVDDPANDTTAVPVDPNTVGNKSEYITGLAILDGGNGNIVASDRQRDEIVEIDRTDGSIAARYPMQFDGSAYDYDYGDMTAGRYCGEVFRRGTLDQDLQALSNGKGIPLDGNRATPFTEVGGVESSPARECFIPRVNHYIGFAWWLPEDVGNEVQSDSVSFDLGFYTEQCRNNDGSGAPVGGGQA